LLLSGPTRGVVAWNSSFFWGVIGTGEMKIGAVKLSVGSEGEEKQNLRERWEKRGFSAHNYPQTAGKEKKK